MLNPEIFLRGWGVAGSMSVKMAVVAMLVVAVALMTPCAMQCNSYFTFQQTSSCSEPTPNVFQFLPYSNADCYVTNVTLNSGFYYSFMPYLATSACSSTVRFSTGTSCIDHSNIVSLALNQCTPGSFVIYDNKYGYICNCARNCSVSSKSCGSFQPCGDEDI